MDVLVVGLNHRTAPLALRERLAVPQTELPAALAALRDPAELAEVVLLATCNRVEVWAATPKVEGAAAHIRRHLERAGGIDAEKLQACLYEYAGADAVRHIFRVASSLDSMVVGEVQIAGQVKEAYAAAAESGTTGTILNRCMTSALHVAKRVRTETAVGRLGSSVAGVAADLAEKIFGDLRGRKVLLVGSGEMAEAAARHLRGVGATEIRICNRSLDRAFALARDLDAQARPWEDLEECLGWADVALSSTGSPEPVIRADLMSRVVRARRYRPFFLIDIAVPRDIEATVADLSNVYVYDLDALNQALAENLARRAREAQGAEALIGSEVDAFLAWKGGLLAVPTIRALVERFTGTARAEEADLLAALPSLSERDRARVRAALDALVHKLLHAPLTALRRAGAEGDGVELVSAARRLFELRDAPSPANPPAGDEAAGDAPRAKT
jgi:glutamyl-tRNA reductase